MSNKRSLLFISSVNLTLNPRILKEIKLALANGYEVGFVGFKVGNWSDASDLQTLATLPALKTYYLSATREPLWPWALSSGLEAVAKLVYAVAPQSNVVNQLASSKRTILLYNFVKELLYNNRYNAVIAHTLPGLNVAYRLFKKYKIPFGFDVEDYHPGEWIEKDAENEKQRRFFLMKHQLPHAKYITAASPLIAGEVNLLIKTDKVISLPNFFSAKEFRLVSNGGSDKIKLVWFSQNINQGRGLEFIVPALDGRFELTLIGKPDNVFVEKFIKQSGHAIKIIEPMPQPELHSHLQYYDIGLALESGAADYNRELALTNKIIAYFQSGLFILATDTKAQQQFLEEHEGSGILCSQSAEGAAEALNKISDNIISIRQLRKERYEQTLHYNWECVQGTLLHLWQDICMDHDHS